MSPLILLPLLAAAVVGAPGGLLRSGLVQNVGLVQQGGLVHTGLVGSQVTYSVPAVQQVQVQVPLTKTVHYETKPVVTGYSTSIIKPALATGFAAAPIAPLHLVQGRQLPPLPSFPVIPAPNNTADAPTVPGLPSFPAFPSPDPNAPGSDVPQIPGFPAFPAFPPIGGGGGAGEGDNSNKPETPETPEAGAPTTFSNQQFQFQQSLPLQQSFLIAPQQEQVFNPINLLSVGQQTVVQAQPAPVQDAVIVEARSAAPAQVIAHAPAQVAFAPAPVQVAQQVVQVRAAQAGDFEPLVTKEKVLAPVRSHTQITPQVTQIQPEVTVRKVIHDVPVAQPIAVQTPVHHVVNQPIVQQQHIVAGPQAVFRSNPVFGHQQVLNGQIFHGQQLINGQQIVL